MNEETLGFLLESTERINRTPTLRRSEASKGTLRSQSSILRAVDPGGIDEQGATKEELKNGDDPKYCYSSIQ
jgi:hypothetical protein